MPKGTLPKLNLQIFKLQNADKFVGNEVLRRSVKIQAHLQIARLHVKMQAGLQTARRNRHEDIIKQ